MLKSLINILAATLLMLSAVNLNAACEHNTYKTNNFMIPTGRLVYNPEFESSNFAVSAIGEVGVRNYRANATVGTWTTERSRLKLTGEYLTQKLGYNFSSGSVNHWVHQSAGGADWQYLLDDCTVFQAVDVKAYYSFASSRHLKDGVCSEIDEADIFFNRRLAGSNAMGGSISTVMVLGENHRLDISLDYDHVKYRRNYTFDKKVHGLGGSFVWLTRLPNHMDFSLEGQFRRPFNYYGARLTWPRECNTINSTVTLFGGWTRGKYNLPNSLKVGLELVYNFTVNRCCSDPKEGSPALWNPCDLNAWTVTPAVYMPEVLVIRDQCYGIVASESAAPIAMPSYVDGGLYSFETASAFSGTGILVYSAQGLPVGTAINQSSGTIAGTITGNSSYVIIVNVTNDCATTSQIFTLSPSPIPQ